MRKVVLMVILAACGDDGVRHTPDATPHDSQVTDSPDSAVDAAALPVTITTTRDGAPVMGVHVYFQNADSTVVLATTTDATGTASAVMAAGGYVTAVDPYTLPAFGGVNDQLDTFAGVKPGDHLQLALVQSSTAIQVTVQAPVDAAANSATVYTPCGSIPLTAPAQAGLPETGTVTLFDCGAMTDFLVVSYDSNGAALNSFFVPNVAIANGQTIDLTAGTYAGVATRTYTFVNPPMYSIQIEDRLIDTQGEIWRGSTFESGSGGSLPVPAFAGAGDVVVNSFQGSGRDTQFLVDWGAYGSAFTTDVGARALREFQSAPMFDATTHSVSVTEDSTGVVPDFTVVEMFASRQSPTFRDWIWWIAAPHETIVTYPTLPTDIYDFNIGSGDSRQLSQYYAGQVPGGYDAVRPYLLNGNFDAGQFAVGPSGSAVIEMYSNPALARTGGVTMAGHAFVPAPPALRHRMR